jgi:uncharacterized protein (TIGR02246 family)
MRRLIVGWLAVVVLLASAAFAGSKPKDSTAADAKAGIEAANAKFEAAYAKGDTAAVAALYTEDAMLFPPDHEIVKGRKAIGEFWAATRKSVTAAKLTTLDVGNAGEVAYEAGTVALTVEAEGKPAAAVAAKYVVVWKRQADGSWQLHRDIWNSLPAAK